MRDKVKPMQGRVMTMFGRVVSPKDLKHEVEDVLKARTRECAQAEEQRNKAQSDLAGLNGKCQAMEASLAALQVRTRVVLADCVASAGDV